MSAKERLGSATRRTREREVDEDDDPPRAHVAPTKRTLSDLAFGPIVGPPPRAAASKLTATMFRSPDIVAGDALKLAENMLARSGIRGVRVDRRARPAAGRAEPDALAAALTHIAGCGPGEPLPAQLAAWMGARLGADLSTIRVHHDDAAHRAATALGAEAFTIGDHVYFARARYQPESEQGLRLLAHEVAHAVQQRSAARGGALEASMPDDLHEADAEAFAARMVREITRTTSASDLRDPAEAVEHARSAGVPIELPFKEEMERHFGVSFDHVKAFTGPAAELACQVMSATAFAIHDIVVLADPSPKRELLLHELTHIMQMGGQRAPARYTKGSLGVSAPDSAAEQEAYQGVVGGAYAIAPQNQVHRATGEASTAAPADTSKLADRVREFRKRQKLDEFPNPEERPFGFRPKTDPVSWPMYRWSLSRPFHLRDYREVVDKAFPGAKTDKDLVDLFSSENDSLREEVRISRVDTESSPSYVITGAQQKYGTVVYDHRPRTAPKDTDQFPAYARYVTAIKAKPSKPLATFEADPADEETAKQYRERLRAALADHYGPMKDGWKVFHAEIVLDPAIFGTPHQRIQGDAFAEIVAKTPLKTSGGDAATMTAVEPQFQPADLAKLQISDKAFARADGYVNTTLQPATRTIVAECKAVTGPPSQDNKDQIRAYAKVTDKDGGIDGYFSQPQEINKQNVKQVRFDHVAFFFSFGDSPTDKQAALAWRDAIHDAFGDDLKRFSIVPPPDGKQIYEIQLNPTFRFQAMDANAKTHRFTEPMQRHAGVKFRHVTIQAEEPGSPKVAGGSVAFDLDMAGAMQASNVEKKIEPQSGSAGRVENKFTGFKSQLDKVLGKVETDAKLTDDGITATLKLQKGAAKIPGFTIDDVELTATLNGDGNLTIAGQVALTHKSGKISGTVGVKWEGAWVFTGTVKVAAGTIDGLNEFEASITYGSDKLVIGADNVALEKAFKGVKLTGSVRGLTYDVKKESFSGFARIDADLGAFGSASAEGELEHNKLKRAEFSYDSPELVYPVKSKSPVFKGTVGGTITYSEGKLSGRIRGTADMNVPLLQKLGNKEGLGLAVDTRIGEDGSYSGSIRSTKPIELGDHFRIPKLVANLEVDGTADAQFSIEIVKIKWLDNAKIGCAIDKNGFRVTDAHIEKAFGEQGKDKVAGAIRVTYAEDKGLLIGGELSIKVREGFVATGKFTYDHETKKVSAELTTEEIHLIKMEPVNKLLFEVKRKIPIFNVWGIGVYVDIGFDLSFNMDFNLSMKPTVGLEELSLETFDYNEITAKIDFIGALVAALVGTPKAGLGIFVVSPDLLSGGGGLEVPISGKLELKPSGGFTLRYKPGDGVEGGAKLGLALTFGITGAVVPYAEFSVLKDTYNPKWKGEPLKEFTILPPRDLLNISIDLGGDLSKPGKVQLPEKDAVAESTEPQGDRTFKSEPAKEEKRDIAATTQPAPVEKPPADPGKTSPGFDIDMLIGALQGFGPVQALQKIVKTAAEVWDKIKGAIGYIVKIVQNWFNSAVEAIEGVLKGIAEKGLARYLGDVVKEKLGERPYRIIQPLFDRFAAVEDKIMSLLEEPFPSSIGEAPGWVWRIFKKLLDIGWSSISALVSAVSEIASNLADAVGDLLTWAVERGMIGVQRHAYWVGIPYVAEHHFLAATEYKIDILGSGIYFKEEGTLNNPKSAVGIALFEVLEAWNVPPTYTAVEEDSGEPYNDRWIGGKGAL